MDGRPACAHVKRDRALICSWASAERAEKEKQAAEENEKQAAEENEKQAARAHELVIHVLTNI